MPSAEVRTEIWSSDLSRESFNESALSLSEPTIGLALQALPELKSYVEEDTGWNLDLSRLSVKIVSRKEGLKLILEDAIARTGLTPSEFKRLSNSDLGVTEKLRGILTVKTVSKMMLAAYLPTKEELVLMRENLEDANVSALRKILYHELVHLGQHQRHPEFCASVGELAKQKLERRAMYGKDDPKVLELGKRIAARMSWIEGQATYLQEIEKSERYPGADPGLGVGDYALALVALALKETRAKSLQYLKGKQAFGLIYEEGGNFEVDQTFSNPKAVDQLFGATAEN